MRLIHFLILGVRFQQFQFSIQFVPSAFRKRVESRIEKSLLLQNILTLCATGAFLDGLDIF